MLSIGVPLLIFKRISFENYKIAIVISKEKIIQLELQPQIFHKIDQIFTEILDSENISRTYDLLDSKSKCRITIRSENGIILSFRTPDIQCDIEIETFEARAFKSWWNVQLSRDSADYLVNAGISKALINNVNKEYNRTLDHKQTHTQVDIQTDNSKHVITDTTTETNNNPKPIDYDPIELNELVSVFVSLDRKRVDFSTWEQLSKELRDKAGLIVQPQSLSVVALQITDEINELMKSNRIDDLVPVNEKHTFRNLESLFNDSVNRDERLIYGTTLYFLTSLENIIDASSMI